MHNLPNRIKQLRKENHLTQEEMAKRLRQDYNLKTDRVMISKWETGFQTPEIYTISCMADLFGVSLDYLNGRTHDTSCFQVSPATFFEDGDCKSSSRNDNELKLVESYRSLNPEGQKKAEEYIEDLSANPKYKIKNNNEQSIAAENISAPQVIEDKNHLS